MDKIHQYLKSVQMCGLEESSRDPYSDFAIREKAKQDFPDIDEETLSFLQQAHNIEYLASFARRTSQFLFASSARNFSSEKRSAYYAPYNLLGSRGEEIKILGSFGSRRNKPTPKMNVLVVLDLLLLWARYKVEFRILFRNVSPKVYIEVDQCIADFATIIFHARFSPSRIGMEMGAAYEDVYSDALHEHMAWPIYALYNTIFKYLLEELHRIPPENLRVFDTTKYHKRMTHVVSCLVRQNEHTSGYPIPRLKNEKNFYDKKGFYEEEFSFEGLSSDDEEELCDWLEGRKGEFYFP